MTDIRNILIYGSLALTIVQFSACGGLAPHKPKPHTAVSDTVFQLPVRPSDSMRLPEFVDSRDSIPLEQRFSDALYALSDTLNKYWDGGDPADIPEEKRLAILQIIERQGAALASLAKAMSLAPDTVDTATITQLTIESLCNYSTLGVRLGLKKSEALLKCADSLSAQKQWQALLTFYQALLEHQLAPTALVRAQFKLATSAYMAGNKNLAEKVWNRQWQQREKLQNIMQRSEDYLKLYDLINLSPKRKEKILLSNFFNSLLSQDTLPELQHAASLVLSSRASDEAKSLVTKLLAKISGTPEAQAQLAIENLIQAFQSQPDTMSLYDQLQRVVRQFPELKLSADSLQALVLQTGSDTPPHPEVSGPSTFEKDDFSAAKKLVAAGQYVKVIPILNRLESGSYANEAKDLKEKAGRRFWKEKRTDASYQFRRYGQEKDENKQIILLQKAAASLDSCLTYFPNATISKTVLKNKNMILDKLQSLAGE